MKIEKLKKLANLIFELGVLKRIPRSGWRNIGIKNPESVAEHVFLTTQITYLLGKMERVNAERATLITLFHDNGETRIGDANLLMKKYLKTDQAEEKAFLDQIKGLPWQTEMAKIYKEWKEQETPESMVAKDADHLALIIEAKEYLDLGNEQAKLWIKYHQKLLKTKSAKRLAKTIGKMNIDEWWKEIPALKKEIKKLRSKR